MDSLLILILIGVLVYYYMNDNSYQTVPTAIIIDEAPSMIAAPLPTGAKPIMDDTHIVEKDLQISDTHYTPYMLSYHNNSGPIPSGPTKVNYQFGDVSCDKGFNLAPQSAYNTRNMC
jgi:hypothetical protein